MLRLSVRLGSIAHSKGIVLQYPCVVQFDGYTNVVTVTPVKLPLLFIHSMQDVSKMTALRYGKIRYYHRSSVSHSNYNDRTILGSLPSPQVFNDLHASNTLHTDVILVVDR